MPIRKDLPSTIERSDKHAQDIYAETHDSAVKTYGEGGRAHRAAYASLKHQYRKSGDKWVPKDRPGASDPQAAGGLDTRRMTAGGYDVGPGASKQTLLDEARDLGIKGRSQMDKDELRKAIMDKAGRQM
jgi:cation transport regulator ChaB